MVFMNTSYTCIVQPLPLRNIERKSEKESNLKYFIFFMFSEFNEKLWNFRCENIRKKMGSVYLLGSVFLKL